MEEKLDLPLFDEWIKNLTPPEETFFFEFDDQGNVVALHPGQTVGTIKNKIQIDNSIADAIYERGETLRHYKIDLSTGTVIKASLNSITGLRKIDDVLHRVIDKRWTNITKPDISIEYNKKESLLTFKINPLLKTIEWQGDQEMIFLITEYNDPNVLQEMININVNELVAYPHKININLPEKFSIYTRRLFDKYTFEIV